MEIVCHLLFMFDGRMNKMNGVKCSHLSKWQNQDDPLDIVRVSQLVLLISWERTDWKLSLDGSHDKMPDCMMARVMATNVQRSLVSSRTLIPCNLESECATNSRRVVALRGEYCPLWSWWSPEDPMIKAERDGVVIQRLVLNTLLWSGKKGTCDTQCKMLEKPKSCRTTKGGRSQLTV